MSSRLIDCLGTTDALADIFSDESVLRAMLEFEAALARALWRAGLIPETAARSIAAAAEAARLDGVEMARQARDSATPVVPFVNALTDRVRLLDAGSARFVHWGATSQDVSDTAMVLLLRRAKPVLAADHARLDRALRRVSEAHAGTLMLGRTLLQPATPITFGLKAAGWCAAVARSWRRLSSAWDQVLVVQCGGAAGTRAAFGTAAPGVVRGLASELGLAAVPPWHTDRDRLGAFIAAGGVYAATLGKVARDIALLMQAEVAEVAEPGGGSSAMPHKRNPSGCAIVLAAATRMPGLVASFLSGMLQEHERSLGGSQAEWPTLAAAVQTTGSAVAALSAVMDGLTVDTLKMRSNLDATGGVIFAERAVLMLAPLLGRDRARALVDEAIRRTRDSGQAFGDALRAIPEVADVAPPDELRALDRPEQYLGEAEALRRQLLEDSSARVDVS